MKPVSLEQFSVYVVVPDTGSDRYLDDKTRPYVLLRSQPSSSRIRGYLMAPLTRRPPSSEMHIPVSVGQGISHLLLDRITTVPRHRIKDERGQLDLSSRARVLCRWSDLLDGPALPGGQLPLCRSPVSPFDCPATTSTSELTHAVVSASGAAVRPRAEPFLDQVSLDPNEKLDPLINPKEKRQRVSALLH